MSSRVATFSAFALLLSSLTHIWVLSVGSLKLLALFQESITTPGLSEVADKFVGAPGAARAADWVEASCLISEALCFDMTYILLSYSLAFILTVQSELKVAFSILNNFLSNLKGSYVTAITAPAFSKRPFCPTVKDISLLNLDWINSFSTPILAL